MRVLPQELINFLAADEASRRNMLRFGFELETQETNGRRHSQRGNANQLFTQAATVRVDENQYTVPELVSALRSRFTYWRERSRDTVERLFAASNIVTMADLVNNGLMVETDATEDQNGNGDPTVRRHLIRNVAERLQNTEPDIGNPAVLRQPLPEIDAGYDGSVSGFEFRTLKGHDYTEATNLASRLLNENNHRIDEACSFHIHVSLPGVFEPVDQNATRDTREDFEWSKRASHNTGFAAQCMASVMANLDKVPDAVLKRWLTEHARQYFKFEVSQGEKYTFVHLHPSGTAEFRCFGNVSKAEDAIACFDLVSQAVHDALSMKYPPVLPYMVPKDYEMLLDNYLNDIKAELERRQTAAVGQAMAEQGVVVAA